MFHTLIRGLAAVLALLSPVSYALAQTTIQVELDAPFAHEGSGITVPSSIDRFDRTSVTDFTDEQLNIAIHLREASGETTLTLFIYRAATPNLSIWGDFAALAMVNNPSVGSLVSGSYFLGRFTPPNASGDGAALHARALVEGGKARSTGLSIFAHNDWMVKLRATSQTLSDDQITAVMGKVLAAIKMEPSETTYPPVTFVEACEKPLKFKKNLVTKRLDIFSRLSMALAANAVEIAKSTSDRADKPWCRDAQSTIDYGVYREAGTDRSYFVALSDAGVGAYVSRFRTTLINTRFSGFLVKTSNGITEEAWPLYDKRVHPAFIVSRYGAMTPIATLDVRPGAEPTSTIVIPPGT